MLIKSVTILGLVAWASAAIIHQRNIPVEVRYDEPVAESVRNLDDKVHVAPVELIQNSNALKEEPEKVTEGTSEVDEPKLYAVRNLDEKVQLSTDQLGQALKHLPVQPADDLIGAETAPINIVEDTPQIEEITKQPDYLQSVLQQAEDIITGGLKKLRISFKPGDNQQVPNPEQWNNLEQVVNEYLNEEKTKFQLKQTEPSAPPSNQNFFQNLASGFQTIANNFIQNISGGQNATQEDEGQPGGANQGPFQGFISYFQGGVNNIANAINGLGNQSSTTSNTVLGDTGTGGTTQPPNFISSFVNNFQQFIGQLQGSSQGGGSDGTQGDTGVNNTASSPQGPGQVIQSIGSAITNFIQGGTRPPNTSGDEGTATTQSSNIIQSIGSVIQNSPLNPFRPQGQKPDDTAGSTQNPIQAGISSIQNIGSQIQQAISGQSNSSDGTRNPENETSLVENSPNVGIQNEQLGSGQNANEASKKPEEDAENNQVADTELDRKVLNFEEEVAIAEELKETQQQDGTEPQVTQEGLQEEFKQERPTYEEVKHNSAQENKLGELLQEEIVRIDPVQEEIKQNEPLQEEVKPVELDQEQIKDKEALQENAKEGELIQEDPKQIVLIEEYVSPQKPLPVVIRKPEPFHIQFEQEDPVQEEIRPREPYQEVIHQEPISEESRPQVTVEQKEEILMTAE